MPKAFKFSLQKVLDVRKHKEEQKAIELFKAEQALNAEKSKLDTLKISKQKALDKKEEKKIDLTSIRIEHDYIVGLSDKIDKQTVQVQKVNKKVDKNRAHLIEAVKEKRAVEILKDRKQEIHKKEQNLEQAKVDNEIAIRISQKNKKDKA